MKYVVIVFGFFCVMALALLFQKPLLSTSLTPQIQNISSVSVGSTTISVEVADTQRERAQGLSGRAELALGHGMLFVFEREGEWGIWMKDMHFPIDILWADNEGRVITIEKNISPDTYPKVFYPRGSALYVLEVPAGYTMAHGVVEGMVLTQTPRL